MGPENKENSVQESEEPDESLLTDLHPHNIPSALVQVDLAAQSHQGFVRDNNEDHYLVVQITRSLELVAQTPDWIMKMNQQENAPLVMRRMTRRFRQIDDELRELGETTRSLQGMGTTLTVAVTLGIDLFLSHIGDSRAYLLRSEKLHQLTKDHTLAQALIDAGIAGPDDTSTRAMRHVLTAALGSTGERTDPQVQRLHLSDGDQLLLCTDGLSEMVADDSIASVLNDAKSSEAACKGLINLALAGGGTDNITVVLARYSFPPVRPE